ncbi:hypothetical protein AAMO2058_000693800 [Amorphochlora amoebiformis]
MPVTTWAFWTTRPDSIGQHRGISFLNGARCENKALEMKKRLTKRQKAEMAALKAEEERLAAEAEVRRLEEQKVKMEELRKELAEKAKAEAKEEVERLKTELKDHLIVEKDYITKLREYESKLQIVSDWNSFIACSDLPDPHNTADLNSFVTTQGEEMDPECKELITVIRTCHQTERMLELIQEAISKHLQEGDTGASLQRLLNTSFQLQKLTMQQLDTLTLNIVRVAEELVDKNGVYRADDKAGLVRFGMWIRFPDEKEATTTDDIELKKIGTTLSVPMALRIERTGIRVMQLGFDTLSPQAPNPLPYVSVGGIFFLQRLAIPEEASYASGWTRRNRNSTTRTLTLLKYPNDGKDTGIMDIAVTLTLPEGLFIPDPNQMKLGWWDTQSKQWKFDGLREETNYDAKTKKLTIHVWRMEPFAVLQERALDFPYRKWHVERCAGGVEVVLTGSRFDVRFRAEASGVRLVSPRIPRFDKLMPPGRLLLALKNIGLNVAPTDEDAKFCCKPLKNHHLAAKAHKDIAAIAGVVDIAGSCHSSGQGPDLALVKIRLSGYSAEAEAAKKAAREKEMEEKKKKLTEEAPPRVVERRRHKGPTPEELAAQAAAERKELLRLIANESPEDRKLKEIDDDQGGWRTVAVSEEKWVVIQATKYNLRHKIYKPAEGCVSHLALRTAAEEALDPEGGLGEVDLLLQATVRRLLNLVRVLVFH